MYEIEKGIPIPSLDGKHVWKERAETSMSKTMASMEVGDSFLTNKTLQAISLAAIRSGANVTSRKEGSMYRVWRTS